MKLEVFLSSQKLLKMWRANYYFRKVSTMFNLAENTIFSEKDKFILPYINDYCI